MLSLVISLILSVNVNAQSNVSPCEWVGPRIDGVSVQVCNGTVTKYRDASGYTLDLSAY